MRVRTDRWRDLHLLRALDGCPNKIGSELAGSVRVRADEFLLMLLAQLGLVLESAHDWSSVGPRRRYEHRSRCQSKGKRDRRPAYTLLYAAHRVTPATVRKT